MTNSRPLIHSNELINAITAGFIRVTVAKIHPQDMDRVDMDWLHALLRCVIIPDTEVERGMLFVDSVPK